MFPITRSALSINIRRKDSPSQSSLGEPLRYLDLSLVSEYEGMSGVETGRDSITENAQPYTRR